MTPLPRAIGRVRRAQRLGASGLTLACRHKEPMGRGTLQGMYPMPPKLPLPVVAKQSSLHIPTPVFNSLVSALVLSRLDYCNSLLIDLPLTHVQRLQSVQNAAVRLIFNLRRCDHITDALISLHWLRVPERIIFKVATLTYRALHGSAPPYLASSLTRVADMPHRRRLRSASTEQLDVPTCRRSTIGGRAFPVAGATVWNGLLSDVTSASSLSVFKNRLKTYLFRRCYETV